MTKLDSTRSIRAMGFAGWLFADVLIVLFVVFMGSEVRHSRVEAATPSPSASSQINKVGVLEKEAQKFVLNGVDQEGIRANDPKALNNLKSLIEDDKTYQNLSNTNRYSPVVLVFSHFKNPDTSLASETSKAACKLSASLKGSIFDDISICRTFIDGELDYGQVRFEVFLVAKQ
jgi:hypothetical protein